MATYGQKPTDRGSASVSRNESATCYPSYSVNSLGFFNRQPTPAQLSVPQKIY